MCVLQTGLKPPQAVGLQQATEKMDSKMQNLTGNHKDKKNDIKEEEVFPGTYGSTPSTTPEDPENKIYQLKMKKEAASEVDHQHKFYVKFGSDKKFEINCTKPRTVLQVIESDQRRQYDKFKKKEKKGSLAEKIIIKVGEAKDSHIIPTHFPCTLLNEEDCLTVTSSPNDVEKLKSPHEKPIVLPKENYSVFFIDKEGGENCKSKKNMIFRCNNNKKPFSYYCVYGTKKTTVKEALQDDGRFVDDLTDFMLSDNKTGAYIDCEKELDSLDGRKFQICDLPPRSKTEQTDLKQPATQDPDQTQNSQEEQEQEGNPSASINQQNKSQTIRVLKHAAEKGVSLITAMEQTGINIDHKEIEEMLRQQFPKLKAWMESRFPGRSLKNALELKQENFGKIQQSFSEVHRLEELLEISKSICKILVCDVFRGTGFVLFDRFILTNAHLFKDCVDGKNLRHLVTVDCQFNYGYPKKVTEYFSFSVEETFVDIDFDLDYAVIKLKSDLTTNVENVSVPAGLLDRFDRPPVNGEACIIGYPAGGVKKIDPTCIIEPENRVQAVNDHLALYNTHQFMIDPIIKTVKQQDIENYMAGGSKADKVTTYNTFMYHGSSGSPVFDGYCRVFGLHTAGFTYGFPDHTQSVIEYAHPVLAILEKLITNLKDSVGIEGVNQLVEEAQKHLEKLPPRVENQERGDDTGENEEEMDTS